MSYTDDALRAKLSALNETQDSIVTVAQWVIFHRRYADRTATLWLNRLKDSGSNKRLNLLYLANEVVQQSKARRKEDFLVAFSPIIAEAAAIAYKGATSEVQNKLRRVIEVWRQRQIFETPIQDAVEARVDELDRSRSASKKPALGGSLFSSSSGPSAPPELQPLVPLQIQLSKVSATTITAVPNADAEYEKLTDPSKPVPTPPVHAARLSALLKNLASAESAVSESIKARHELLEGLDKLVEANRIALAAEEAKNAELSSRKASIENKKREVEDSIMRNLSADSSPITPAEYGRVGGTNGNSIMSPSNGGDPERPDVEELTPPPPDMSTTPTGDPPNSHIAGEYDQTSSNNANTPSAFASPPPKVNSLAAVPPPLLENIAGSDLLSSLNVPPVHHFAGTSQSTNTNANNNGFMMDVGAAASNSAGVGVGIGVGGGSVPKKRKLDDEADVFGGGGDAMADLDEDVAELLRAESGGR